MLSEWITLVLCPLVIYRMIKNFRFKSRVRFKQKHREFSKLTLRLVKYIDMAEDIIRKCISKFLMMKTLGL